MNNISIDLIIAFPMALWVYILTKKHEKSPMTYAFSALFAWPIPSVIFGYRYRQWLMFGLGCVGMDLLLATISLLSSALANTKQLPADRISFVLIGLIPVVILTLISLVLIAKRCRGQFWISIHAYVAFQILCLIVWPWVLQYLHSVAPEGEKFSWTAIASSICWLGLTLISIIIVWLGYILCERQIQKRFKWSIILWTLATVVALLSSRIAFPVFMSWTFFQVIQLLFMSFPPLILLNGVLRVNESNAAHPASPTPTKIISSTQSP